MSKPSRSGKARSGGGLTSNKLVRPKIKTGPPRTNVVEPHAPDFLGQATSFKKPPLYARTAPAVPLGNECATRVGAGKPGADRTVYKTGFQSLHGATASGERIGPDRGGADRGRRQILGPPANTGAVRRGQQRGE
jgi:hypothetical protein